MRTFENEEGRYLTEEDLKKQIGKGIELEDYEDIMSLSINGAILIDTVWIKRIS